MTRYSNDPRAIRARWRGKCSKCGAQIMCGELAYYYPKEKRLLGMTACECGNEASRDFEAAAADEDFMQSQF